MSDPLLLILILGFLFLIYKVVSTPVDKHPHQQPQQQRQVSSQPPRLSASQNLHLSSLLDLFPAFNTPQGRVVLQSDLLATGSFDVTLENILGGRLVAPPPPQPQPASPTSPSTTPSKSSSMSSLSQSSSSTPISTPPSKAWAATPTERQSNLRLRKQWMLDQARQKLLEKERQKQEGTVI